MVIGGAPEKNETHVKDVSIGNDKSDFRDRVLS